MIPIPDEENSLYTPNHIFDQISMYIIIICLSLDILYYIISILFVRMWYESQPSFLRICRMIGIHYIFYWMILLDLYVYSRTVHYTNNQTINLRNRQNDTILTTIAMVVTICTSICLVVFMTYHKLQHTRQYIIEGGPPLPIETFQQQYLMQQQQQPPAAVPIVIVITGANTGIGKETVRLLYQILSVADESHHYQDNHQPTATIFLLCRSIDKGNEAIQDILYHSSDTSTSTGSKNTNSSSMTTTTRIQSKQCQLQVIPCDLCSFRSIRNAVNQILNYSTNPIIDDDTTTTSTTTTAATTTNSALSMSSQDKPKVIHTLINNAGVMLSHLTYTNDDHHETCLQANFLGHFLLSSLLLPHISTSIINLTSSTYQLNVKPLLIPSNDGSRNNSWNGDDIQCRSRRKFTLFGQYAITKWCNMLHSIYLSKHYSHLFYSSSVHPGLVRTDVTRNMPYYLRIPNEIFAIVLQTLQKTPIQGAWNTIHVFAIAAKWYDTDSDNIVRNDRNDKSTESSPLQQTPPQQQNTQCSSETNCWKQPPSGQYWVNRQPQPIQSRCHFATRIDEQAEAVWDWAVQQVQLTKEEIQQLQRLKIKTPMTAMAHDNATEPLTTTTTTPTTNNHSKVE